MKFRLLLVGLALVMLLAACGPKSSTFDVDMKEFTFTPNAFTAPAGVQVTLNLKNSGALEHNFIIMKQGTDATLPFDEEDEGNIYWKAEVPAFESATFTFTAPADPGVYHVVCSTAGHLEQNMRATLTVTEP